MTATDREMQWLVGHNDGTGYKYGVVAEHEVGKAFELHGFFPTFADAKERMRKLRLEYEDYGHIKIVKIELPEVTS